MEVELRPTLPTDPDAVALNEALSQEVEERADLLTSHRPPPLPSDLVAPHGVLFVAYIRRIPVGLGGIRRLDADTAEIKRMYVAPSQRRCGLGRTLLAELERKGRELGCTTARLDSAEVFTEAIAMYRSAGYEEIADYNGNPRAQFWFEKRL